MSHSLLIILRNWEVLVVVPSSCSRHHQYEITIMNAGLLEERQDVAASGAGGSLEAAGDDENLIEDEGLLLTSEDADLCCSQQIYIESGNNIKVLFLLCVGMNDDNDVPVFMFENEPWSCLPKYSSMRPKNTDL